MATVKPYSSDEEETKELTDRQRIERLEVDMFTVKARLQRALNRLERLENK